MTTLLTFPGQGAQRPGMLHALPAHPEVTRTLEEACDGLGQGLSELDSADALRSTQAVQLSLLIAGVASARLLADAGCEPDMVLGLSIGAYPAAVAAGSLTFADALQLVRLRGALMQQAYPSGYGMSAVIGLSLAQVERLVAGQFREEEPVYVANINSAEQIVVAGHENGLARLAEAAVRDFHARKVHRIAISVPSHCMLLSGAASQMRAAFDRVTVSPSRCTYVSASSARALFQADAIRDDLAFNMARQVHWHDAAIHARERGARLAIEALPGATLTSLCRPVFADGGEAVSLCQAPLATVLALHSRL